MRRARDPETYIYETERQDDGDKIREGDMSRGCYDIHAVKIHTIHMIHP